MPKFQCHLKNERIKDRLFNYRLNVVDRQMTKKSLLPQTMYYFFQAIY